MPNRDPDLAIVLSALETAWAAKAPAGSGVATATREAARRMQTIGAPGAPTPERPAVYSWFEAAIANAAPPATASLGQGLAKLGPRLAWRARTDRPSDNPDFPNAHANAVLVGDGGIESRDDLRIGVSLLAPHTVYPNHRHPPEEVYVVMSEGEWRQNAGPWRAPGHGGLVHNTPNIVHGMQSGDKPLLAIWTLLMDGPGPARPPS